MRDDLPPAELVVRLGDDVLVRDGGRLLGGGVPYRLTRLTAAGAEWVARRRAAAPIGPGAAARTLARRLLDAGMLVPDPAPRPAAAGEVAIVVPTRDRPAALDRCLAALAAANPSVPVVVVDDGSAQPAAVERIALRHGASVVHHAVGRGPSAARNAGLATTTEPVVAFVDSDVVVEPGWLERLVAQLDDPAVGAAAPRVLALAPGDGRLARYEVRHSRLDMGPRPGTVGAGRPLSYVPTATLVVRRAAVPGGFDEELHVGEDVDFVWRMSEDGWRVAYDPAATVRHDHRVRPAAFLRRRWDYARSIGLLARRHPHALPAMYIEPWTAATFALLALRRRVAAATVLALGTARLRNRLVGHTDHPTALAADLTVRGLRGTARGVAHAVRRTWAPLLIVAAPRHRRAAAVLLAAYLAPALDDDAPAPRDLPLAAADDLIAACGAWAGCLEHRTLRPLLPARPRRSRAAAGTRVVREPRGRARRAADRT